MMDSDEDDGDIVTGDGEPPVTPPAGGGRQPPLFRHMATHTPPAAATTPGRLPMDGRGPKEEPLPVESAYPEDDDDVDVAVATAAVFGGKVDPAPETAAGLDELEAQLHLLRWGQPGGAA